MIKKLIQLLRVDNWVKNLIIFFPYFLSGGPYRFDEIISLTYLFVLFSIFVSATYIFNDIIDLQSDKMHPIKKFRPLASNKFSINFAILISILLLSLSITGILNLNKNLLFYFVGYLFITVSYTLKLKYLKYFDLISIVSLFILRLLVGGAIVNIELTIWLILFVFFTSLGLVSGKKLSILISTNQTISPVKNFLQKNYSKMQLKNLILMSFVCSLITYVIWFVVVMTPNLPTQEIIILIFTNIFLSIFLISFYLSSSKGQTEDVVKSLLSEKTQFISLIIFSILVLVVLW